jgi:hypothetical protein
MLIDSSPGGGNAEKETAAIKPDHSSTKGPNSETFNSVHTFWVVDKGPVDIEFYLFLIGMSGTTDW